jgi:hypothetical protein
LDTGTAWSRSIVKPVVLVMFKGVCGANLLNNKCCKFTRVKSRRVFP